MWAERQFEDLPIMIAEDCEDDLLLLNRALFSARVQNPRLIVRSGDEAIRLFSELIEEPAEAFPVVLFLDLLMPRVGGMAVLRWLQEHEHPPMQVVLHTGVEDDLMLQEARDLGARFFLPKGTRAEAVMEVFRLARVDWEQHRLVVT